MFNVEILENIERNKKKTPLPKDIRNNPITQR